MWLTKSRQRFHNKALMEDVIAPPPKSTALSPAPVKAGLLLKPLGNGVEEDSCGWGSSQGGTASLHHSATACRARKHNQSHFSMERSSSIVLQMGKITEGTLALWFKNILQCPTNSIFHSYHVCFSYSLNAILWDCDVWCNILWDSHHERNIKLEKMSSWWIWRLLSLPLVEIYTIFQ